MNRIGSAGLIVTAILLSSYVLADEPDREVVPTYSVLDPRGTRPAMERIPLSERLPDLTDRTLYIINSWPRPGSGFEEFVESLHEYLVARYSGIDVRITNRNAVYSEDDPELWELLRDQADAFLYVAAPSSSTTAYAFQWSAGLERLGLPGSVLMFDTFLGVAEASRNRAGAQLRFTSIPYPAEGMDAAAMQDAFDDVISTLTAPTTDDERRSGEVPSPERSRLLMTGTLDEVHRYFDEAGIGDGLPIIPPTEERVAAMVSGTSRSPEEVITSSMPPEGLEVTVEKVAMVGVMVGAKPEHMPVLLASLEAFLHSDLNAMVRSTNSFGFMQVVNGPIRNELGLNSGTVLLGPGNHPNSVIGRALRMFIFVLGGGRPEANLMGVIGTMATWPFLFGEAEEHSPWEPFGVSRGFRPDESTLSLFVGGIFHAGNYGHVDFDLQHVADDLAEFEMTQGAAVIVSPKRAELLAQAGMSKQDVEEYLQRNARKTLGSLRRSRYFSDEQTRDLPDTELVSPFAEDTVHVIVAGGDASPMMQAWHMVRPVTVSIDKWR